MARLPVCVLVLACMGGTAAAQHARFPRQQPAPPPVVLSERVKPLVAKPVDAIAGKPAIDADAVLSIETLRSPARVETEQILADLIANTPDSDAEEKSDYYFRLGELYAKQQRLFRLKAAEAAIQVDKAKTPQQKSQAQANAKAADDKAKMYLLKAVKTYKGLTDNDAFRNYPKLDMALFYYGYTLQGGKYMKEARTVYDKLLKNYPNSQYVPEAHLAFADYYFEQGQLADAEARYKQVLKFPKSSAYWYAMYKLGWIHRSLSRSQDALETFFQVAQGTQHDKAQEALYKAAKQDFVRAYAEIGKTDRAYDVFQKLDKSAAVDLAELLADTALDSGALDRAVIAYRDLLTRARGDARACRWQYQVAHATLSTPGVATAAKIKEIEALVHSYASQQQPTEECRANAAAMSGELAAAFYAEWSKTQNLETLGHAEQLYAAHVAAFPAAAAERATYAEVLWARAERETNPKLRGERWQRAAEVFGATPSQEAARAAALAWLNALDVVLPDNTKVVLGKAPHSRPRALPLKGRDAKLVAAVAAYAQTSPTPDAELAQMRLAAATILRRYRHFDEAATVLDVLLADQQDDPHAELAANLLLDSMIQAGKLDEALEVADAIAADRSFVAGKHELQRNLDLVRAGGLH